jgi:hypothetical protein
MAGGGLRRGEVIGSSDAHAAEPHDRPITPPELVATIYRSLGLDPMRTIALRDGEPMALAQGAEPIAEAFA